MIKQTNRVAGKESVPRWMAIALSATTLALPFLYIFGFAYDLGYLEGYGVSNEFFPRSVQEYLVHSFFACLGIAVSVLEFADKNYIIFLITSSSVAALVFAYMAIESKALLCLRARTALCLKNCKWLRFILISVSFGAAASAIPYLVIAVISVVLLIPGSAYFKGKTVAEKEILQPSSCVFSKGPQCINLIDNGKIVASGWLVARSSTHMAVFWNGKTTIYPIKDQVVEIIPKFVKQRDDVLRKDG